MNIINIHDSLSKFNGVEIRLVNKWDEELMTEVPTYVCEYGENTNLPSLCSLIKEKFGFNTL